MPTISLVNFEDFPCFSYLANPRPMTHAEVNRCVEELLHLLPTPPEYDRLITWGQREFHAFLDKLKSIIGRLTYSEQVRNFLSNLLLRISPPYITQMEEFLPPGFLTVGVRSWQ